MTPSRSALLAALTLIAGLAAAAPAAAAECPNAGAATVPGAERQEQACLDDLTTAGTQTNGHTDRSDWEGLHATGTRNPTGVPGLQIDGYFPDTSTSNGTHGWNHDSQFVVRMPNDWNGKLVITGAPGVRKQYASDFVIGDFVLGRGYAYASTDKGNTGTDSPTACDRCCPATTPPSWRSSAGWSRAPRRPTASSCPRAAATWSTPAASRPPRRRAAARPFPAASRGARAGACKCA